MGGEPYEVSENVTVKEAGPNVGVPVKAAVGGVAEMGRIINGNKNRRKRIARNNLLRTRTSLSTIKCNSGSGQLPLIIKKIRLFNNKCFYFEFSSILHVMYQRQ